MPRNADCRSDCIIERHFEPDPQRCVAALIALLEKGQKNTTPTGTDFGRPVQSEFAKER